MNTVNLACPPALLTSEFWARQLAEPTIASLQVTFSASSASGFKRRLTNGVRVVSARDIELLIFHGLGW